MKELKQIIKEEVKRMINEQEDSHREILVQNMDQARQNYKDSKYSNTPQQTIRLKHIFNKAENELERYEREQKSKALNLPSAKKIFKKFGLSATTRTGRSFKSRLDITSPNSYEIDQYNAKNITFHHITKDTFDKIVQEMKTQGFQFRDINEPKDIYGGSNISNILLK